MMRCPGCNVGNDSGVRFSNCAGCGGKGYRKKPEFEALENYQKRDLDRGLFLKKLYKAAWEFALFGLGFLLAYLIFK